MTIEQVAHLVAILVGLAGLVAGIGTWFRVGFRVDQQADDIKAIRARAEDAHTRISVMAEAHHMLREEIAGRYIDKSEMREALREHENRLSSDIDALRGTINDAVKSITARIDTVISERRRA